MQMKLWILLVGQFQDAPQHDPNASWAGYFQGDKKVTPVNNTSWTHPSYGVLKPNFDGSYRKEELLGGFSGVWFGIVQIKFYADILDWLNVLTLMGQR